MPEPARVAAVIAVAAPITFALRALPFTIASRLREARVAQVVGRLLPAGLMTILLVYLLCPPSHTVPADWIAQLAATAVTVALQTWRRSTLLSIAAGTTVFLLLH
ncbi:branched-chain amino acid transporter permease [Streptomyces montanisoli]|uniref:AzlD domain-containing protein n=1 Tax=Streptomyces montanisoli TaxID=2798581 RepID=A0A940RX72_9ACTN|nr:AzlD domain-containing protein [Streptomyces montanisoli]MBP0457314.1 AzlD domain-containing protein [Streptomyces montanisoli]